MGEAIFGALRLLAVPAPEPHKNARRQSFTEIRPKVGPATSPRGAQSLNDIFQMSSSHLYLVTGLGCVGHTVTTPNESARS